MPHPRQHITDLAAICRKKGIISVVISPGSRSAPLIQAFYEVFGDQCISIVDERSAAYFALGIAARTRTPVVLICTSGTAVLNYAPALAEAFYQGIPLLAVTADRPREWIDQQDNQTLKQPGIYRNFIRAGYELPQVITTDDELWFAQRMVNEAVNLCTAPGYGPVHINVPLTEPLYDELPPPSGNIRIITHEDPGITLTLPEEMIREWKNAHRIMIIHGQDFPGSETSQLLPSLLNDGRIILLAENIANIPAGNAIANSNLVLSLNRDNSPQYPDLIIHSGGQVVSKALTGYLRRAGGVSCWRVGPGNTIVDTFRQATRVIEQPPAPVYQALLSVSPALAGPGYRESWLAAAEKANRYAGKIMQQAPFSDLAVFNYVFRSLPGTNLVSLGNSSIIRYAQLFQADVSLSCYANRGVSGIDGCLSTAAGIAFASKLPTLAVTGDLGFIYDSNSLWNNELPVNLRILVLNNGGGGIFHIIKGPSEQPGFKKFVEADHPVKIHKLAEAFGLDYYYADEITALEGSWASFLAGNGRAAVFEVKTNAEISALTFRQIMTPARQNVK
jgi:2-succinyl-5-enolpyruvyl-6-hydroxy-3-cyclohexene-1-carboxylate synthase